MALTVMAATMLTGPMAHASHARSAPPKRWTTKKIHAPGSTVRARAARVALSRVGRRYCRGGTRRCYDCSGLTYSSYQAVGKHIPRTSWGQQYATRRISLRRALPGDLLFYGGHVEMYIGHGKAVAANTYSRPVNVHLVRHRGLIKVGRVT